MAFLANSKFEQGIAGWRAVNLPQNVSASPFVSSSISIPSRAGSTSTASYWPDDGA
jgi:hypothetical protein